MALEIYIKQPKLEITIKSDEENVAAAIEAAKQLVPSAATDLIGTTVVTTETREPAEAATPSSPTLNNMLAYYRNNGYPDLDILKYKTARSFVENQPGLVADMSFEKFRAVIRKVESLGRWKALHPTSIETYYGLAKRLLRTKAHDLLKTRAVEDADTLNITSCNDLVVNNFHSVSSFENLEDWSIYFRAIEERLALKPVSEISLKTYYNKAIRLTSEASNV